MAAPSQITGSVRWRFAGSLIAGVAVASVVFVLGTLSNREREATVRSRETGIAAAIADRIGDTPPTPGELAAWERISAATLVARGPDRSVTAEGEAPGSRATRGVPVPGLAGWRGRCHAATRHPDPVARGGHRRRSRRAGDLRDHAPDPT